MRKRRREAAGDARTGPVDCDENRAPCAWRPTAACPRTPRAGTVAPGRGQQGGPRLPTARLRDSPDTQLLPHAVAAVLTAVVLALGAWILLWTPQPRPGPDRSEDRLQLRMAPRIEAGQLPPPIAQPAAPSPRARRQPEAPPQAEAPVAAAAPRGALPSAPAGARLYDPEGRILLPTDPVAGAKVPVRPLQPPNPVDYRGTRFEGDWVSDGDLADVTGQAIARGQRKVAELLLGKDIQHARARPAPEVAYNPARHERPEDLGSEATGDAWRAAPINAEPVPGLDGRASRSIREQVAQLERDHRRCPRDRLEALTVPVRRALDELQAVEHALANGADPVRAQHQLPNAAHSAWDQARRGLWHARHRLADCRG